MSLLFGWICLPLLLLLALAVGGVLFGYVLHHYAPLFYEQLGQVLDVLIVWLMWAIACIVLFMVVRYICGYMPPVLLAAFKKQKSLETSAKALQTEVGKLIIAFQEGDIAHAVMLLKKIQGYVSKMEKDTSYEKAYLALSAVLGGECVSCATGEVMNLDKVVVDFLDLST